jgi:dihydrofolate synthase/folylpolyglutamate synthase
MTDEQNSSAATSSPSKAFAAASDAYTQALQVLRAALRFGIDPSLEPIARLLEKMGRPERSFVSVQVAGTNGKSSTSRFIAALLRSQGMKVGLYTSPELVFYEERIEIDGAVVSREAFAEAVLAAHEAAQVLSGEETFGPITEFELLTAAAFWLFARERVELAVLECGLGGRWDATSVVEPAVAVITGVGLDHTAILGNTLAKIAAEKAAIIKSGSIPVLGPGTAATREIFLARCAEVGQTPLIVAATGTVPLAAPLNFAGPSYQRENLTTALVAAQAAFGGPLNYAKAQAALDELRIFGRFEIVRDEPLLLIDAAHNQPSAAALADALIERFGQGSDGLLNASAPSAAAPTLLLGILADKDAAGIIEALGPLFAEIAVTQSASARALGADELANLVRERLGRASRVFSSVASALNTFTAQGTPLIVTGSITTAGEAAAWVRETLGT